MNTRTSSVVGEPPEVGPALLVAHRRDHAARLVQHEVALLRVELHGRAVDGDLVGDRVDARAELGHDAPVHLDASGDDEVLGDAAARDARGRERLLEAHALARVAAAAQTRSRSNPSWPPSSSGEIGGSSSSDVMPRFVSSTSVVP